MKNNILYLFVASLVLLTACHDPEEVAPTIQRQGITSLTAKFTSGPNVEKEAVKYTVSDATTDTYIIPIPWFYPETSDDATTEYMTAMKIEAELANNCKLSPVLGILDLTKENFFTFTSPNGEQRRICIKGERTKSSKCQLLAFALLDPELTGIIDEQNKTISLISADDLSACLAEYTISSHATISPDPATTALNYNESVKLTVTAHNGVDKKEYTVLKNVPNKIDYGFRKESVEPIFALDATQMGIQWLGSNAPTMAAVNNHLVVCMGDGRTPIYLNRITGQKLGNINLGSAKPGSVANDNANHLLISTHAQPGETFEIWTTSSVTAAPELFFSMPNAAGLSIGAKVKVQGDIKGDALITTTCEGVSGVTSSSTFIRLAVKGGVVQTPEIIDLAGIGLAWGSAPVNNAGLATASADVKDGYFLTYYDPNQIYYINQNNGIVSQVDGGHWALNLNCLDAKPFNNARYLAALSVSHFPMWGIVPNLYMYDITNTSQFTGGVGTSPACVLKNENCPTYQTATSNTASGDVLLVPSQDGFKLHLYYYDNNCAVIGAYEMDCIDK